VAAAVVATGAPEADPAVATGSTLGAAAQPPLEAAVQEPMLQPAELHRPDKVLDQAKAATPFWAAVAVVPKAVALGPAVRERSPEPWAIDTAAHPLSERATRERPVAPMPRAVRAGRECQQRLVVRGPVAAVGQRPEAAATLPVDLRLPVALQEAVLLPAAQAVA
jgi:hypothetical protein